MTPGEFDAHFGRFTSSVFRLETLQDYADPGEAERVAAFRRGAPRPERSIRTSPWLARIASATLAGKRWLRVRVVEEPLTEYTRYELAGYVESQAAGEEIRIARRAADPAVATLRRDFWLLDAGTDDEFALLMNYGPGGKFEGAGLVTNPETLLEFQAERDLALRWSVPLNEYLATIGRLAALVGLEGPPKRPVDPEQRLAPLEQAVGRVEAALIDLYGKLGYNYPRGPA